MGRTNVWFERLDALEGLNALNPNKYTNIEKMALGYIRCKLSEGEGWLQRSINRHDKGDDTLTDAELGRVNDWIMFIKQVTYIEDCLSTSNLLKPIRGLVIHRDRELNIKSLVYCRRRLSELTEEV
jgi:hypothetical protein